MLVDLKHLTVISVSTKDSTKDNSVTTFVSLKVLADGYVKNLWAFNSDLETLPKIGQVINVKVWISAKVSARDSKPYLTYQVKSYDQVFIG